MVEFEKSIEKAVAEQEIPGCVLCATNRDGSFTYSKAFGKRSLKENGDQSPLQLNTIMWIASCTKLMTAVCVAQLVERGLVTLDEPVYKHLPELKALPILKGFNDDGTPIEKPQKNPITLRLLLTHTSGLCYEGLSPDLLKWLKYHDKPLSTQSTIVERFNVPLVFEPGTSWMYGTGIDWAGKLVERVAKLSLEEYMKKNLWEPLGVKDMTFSLSRRPDLKARMADMSGRDDPTGKVRYTDERMSYQTGSGDEVEDCMGGTGVFASAEEYIKILQAVLTTDETEKILKKDTTEELFRPQMNEGGIAGLATVLSQEMANNAMGGMSDQVEKDYGLGGLVIKGDSPDGTKDGTMSWGGYPNLTWFVDRKAGLCGLYAGQVVPPGDAKCAALFREFESGMYEMYSKSRGDASRL